MWRSSSKNNFAQFFGDTVYSSLESPCQLPIHYNRTFFAVLRLRRYKRKSVEVGVFRREWVTLNANFKRKGASPINHRWCQKTRVIALSCGKLSAVYCLVLSQSTRVTDGRTDRQTDRTIYYSEDRANIAACGNNGLENWLLAASCKGKARERQIRKYSDSLGMCWSRTIIPLELIKAIEDRRLWKSMIRFLSRILKKFGWLNYFSADIRINRIFVETTNLAENTAEHHKFG